VTNLNAALDYLWGTFIEGLDDLNQNHPELSDDEFVELCRTKLGDDVADSYQDWLG